MALQRNRTRLELKEGFTPSAYLYGYAATDNPAAVRQWYEHDAQIVVPNGAYYYFVKSKTDPDAVFSQRFRINCVGGAQTCTIAYNGVRRLDAPDPGQPEPVCRILFVGATKRGALPAACALALGPPQVSGGGLTYAFPVSGLVPEMNGFAALVRDGSGAVIARAENVPITAGSVAVTLPAAAASGQLTFALTSKGRVCTVERTFAHAKPGEVATAYVGKVISPMIPDAGIFRHDGTKVMDLRVAADGRTVTDAAWDTFNPGPNRVKEWYYDSAPATTAPLQITFPAEYAGLQVSFRVQVREGGTVKENWEQVVQLGGTLQL